MLKLWPLFIERATRTNLLMTTASKASCTAERSVLEHRGEVLPSRQSSSGFLSVQEQTSFGGFAGQAQDPGVQEVNITLVLSLASACIKE